MTLKSLAHPDWPYLGTSWEWRGFTSCRPLTKEEGELIQKSLIEGGGKNIPNACPDFMTYQKQNFGNLD